MATDFCIYDTITCGNGAEHVENWQEIVKLVVMLLCWVAIGVYIAPRQKGGFC